MTTRRKLIAQVKRLLSNGPTPKDSKLSDKYLAEEINQVTHNLLKLDWYRDKNEGRSDVNHLMIATYDTVSVVNDEDRNRNYALLPAFPMNLPKGMGVQQVKPITGNLQKDVAMIPILPFELELLNSLLVGEEVMVDQFMYELDRSKIWFTESNNETLLEAEIDTVEVKMVILDPAQVEDTDPYPIAPEMEFDVLKGVLMLHGFNPQQAVDVINDNNPNIK